MFERLLGNVKGNFNIITIIEMAYSLVIFLFGIIFIARENMNLTTVCILVGLLMIIYGGMAILFYNKRDTIELYNYNILFGPMMILCGIITFFARSFLPIMICIFLLMVGIQRIVFSVLFKKYNESSWLMTLVVAVMLIVIAFITLSANEDTACKVAGICLVGFSIFNIVNMLLLRRRSEYFLA